MEQWGLNLRELQGKSVSPEVFVAGLRNVGRQLYRRRFGSGASADGIRVDAAGVAAVRDVEHVVAEVIRTEFGRRFSEELIPMGSEGASPWAKRVVYKRVTNTGLAQWVNSADMPWSEVEVDEEPRDIHTMGAKVGWTIFELEESRLGSVPLDAEKLFGNKQAIDESRDIVMLAGDSGLPGQSGLIKTGLINDPQVPISAAVAAFDGRGSDLIISDVIGYTRTYSENNRQKRQADRLLLPSSQYYQMKQPRATGTDTSIAEYLLKNTSLTSIDELPQLEGAGVGGSDRAILYQKDPLILTGLMILPYRAIDPQMHDLMTTICAIERQAGVVVKRPPGILYIDGI